MKKSKPHSKYIIFCLMMLFFIWFALINQLRIHIWLNQVKWLISKPAEYSIVVRSSCIWSVSSNTNGDKTVRSREGQSCERDHLNSLTIPDVDWLFAASYTWCTPAWEACEISFDNMFNFPTEIYTNRGRITVYEFQPCVDWRDCLGK